MPFQAIVRLKRFPWKYDKKSIFRTKLQSGTKVTPCIQSFLYFLTHCLGQFWIIFCLLLRNLAKSWFTLAGWSYKKGRKVVDSVLSAGSFTDAASPVTPSTLAPFVTSLSKSQRDTDRQTFLALLPTSWMTQEEIDDSLDVLEQVRFMGCGSWEVLTGEPKKLKYSRYWHITCRAFWN